MKIMTIVFCCVLLFCCACAAPDSERTPLPEPIPIETPAPTVAPEPTPLPTEPPAPTEAPPVTITEADIIDGLDLYLDTLAQSGAKGEYELHTEAGIITTVITMPSATMATATPEALEEFADLVFANMNVCVIAANAGEGLPIAKTDLENGYYGGLFDTYDATIALVDETGYIYADYMLLRTTHDVMAFYGESTASEEAEPSADADPTPTPKPEPEPTPEPEPEPTPDSEPSGGGMVYIPKSGSKYHSSPDCSNMKNPSEVSESTAKSMGYEPCSKCW